MTRNGPHLVHERVLLQCPSPYTFGKRLDVRELPRLVEVGLLLPIEAEVGEPASVGQGLNEVCLHIGKLLGAEIEVHGAVVVREKSLRPRRDVDDFTTSDRWFYRSGVPVTSLGSAPASRLPTDRGRSPALATAAPALHSFRRVEIVLSGIQHRG